MSGTNTNPQETAGVFNALLRLTTALNANDQAEIQRDAGQLQQASQNLSVTQASLGAEEQTLSSVQTQLTSQNTQLQTLLSNNQDVQLGHGHFQPHRPTGRLPGVLADHGADVQDEFAQLPVDRPARVYSLLFGASVFGAPLGVGARLPRGSPLAGLPRPLSPSICVIVSFPLTLSIL